MVDLGVTVFYACSEVHARRIERTLVHPDHLGSNRCPTIGGSVASMSPRLTSISCPGKGDRHGRVATSRSPSYVTMRLEPRRRPDGTHHRVTDAQPCPTNLSCVARNSSVGRATSCTGSGRQRRVFAS